MMGAMNPTDDAWGRLARAVADRRNALGKSQVEVATDGGISLDSVQAIEAARRSSYRSKTLRGLERGLDWPMGAIDTALAGGEPTATPSQRPSHDETVAEIRRTLAALRQDLRDHLGDRNQPVGDALIDGLEALVEDPTSETPRP
jgi:transcriptional regulator with XRE-family HTH domain